MNGKLFSAMIVGYFLGALVLTACEVAGWVLRGIVQFIKEKKGGKQ